MNPEPQDVNGGDDMINVSVRIHRDTAERFRQIAESEFRPMAAELRRMIEERVEGSGGVIPPRFKHAELLVAAITAEAHAERLPDADFRRYVIEVTENADLPRHLSVVPPDEAA